jgi:hypothetical protein
VKLGAENGEKGPFDGRHLGGDVLLELEMGLDELLV